MQQKYLEKTRQELRLRNYSLKTIKAYLSCLCEAILHQSVSGFSLKKVLTFSNKHHLISLNR